MFQKQNTSFNNKVYVSQNENMFRKIKNMFQKIKNIFPKYQTCFQKYKTCLKSKTCARNKKKMFE